MNGQFTLVPLDCPSCGAGIEADGDDIVYYCTACRNGYRFDQGRALLEPVEVSFVTQPDKSADLYRPFWLLPSRVVLHQREAKGVGVSGLLGFFFGGDEPRERRAEGIFAIPAFHASLVVVTELTRRYTEALPSLGEKLGERLLGGCYDVEDAKKLAHYALIASEVSKPDMLTNLSYDIEFGPARLLGVPFVHRGRETVDAIFGLGGPQNAPA